MYHLYMTNELILVEVYQYDKGNIKRLMKDEYPEINCENER